MCLFQRLAIDKNQRDINSASVTVRSIAALFFLSFFCIKITRAENSPVKSLLELRQERVIVQKWDLSCGAAALATLLNYQHGDKTPEREIAQALIQRKEYIAKPMQVRIQHGFSLLDLKRYVDAKGYQGIGYGKLKFSDLLNHAPLLVPVNFYGYNHFVVFRGINGNRALLADPAWGNRTLTIERFKNAWIQYPKFGKVGFEVLASKKGLLPNQLIPHAKDFVMLR